MKTLISASILSSNFAQLGNEVEKFTNLGVDMIHIDVMDGHFVPNITIGPQAVQAIRKHSKLLFDVHLMISNPEQHIRAFADAGADIITIHYESVLHHDMMLTKIRKLGKKAGIALLPSTPPSVLDYLLDKLDLILVMTVNPGAGGQQFLTAQLPKISVIASKISQCPYNIMLAVDGGINDQTVYMVTKAGANVIVVGSFIADDNIRANNINKLRV